MERILFPICLREDLGEKFFAYPLPDKAVRDHFADAPDVTNEANCKAYIRSFLSSLFASVLDQASKLFPSDSTQKYETLAKTFYDFFADSSQRDVFYRTVVANVQQGPYGEVWGKLKELQKYLKDRCSDWPLNFCPFIISIDEVHVLYTPRSKDTKSDYTLYSRLKSVLYEGVSHPIAVVSLSTESHGPSVAPPKEVAPSMRERAVERILPAPFTELPFDVYVIADPLRRDQATLNSVGSLKFTAKFG